MFVFFELAPGFGDLKLLIKFIDELFYPVFDSKYLEMLLDPGFFLITGVQLFYTRVVHYRVEDNRPFEVFVIDNEPIFLAILVLIHFIHYHFD